MTEVHASYDPAAVLAVRLTCAAEQVLVDLARHRLGVLTIERIRKERAGVASGVTITMLPDA